MKGLGYGHETFRHGSYHGPLDVLRERLVLSDMGPENLHIQAMCDVVLTALIRVKKLVRAYWSN